jgi:diaminopimelate epimerase
VSFYNADGSEAMACGNGSRALANYLFQEKDLSSPLTLRTKGGELMARQIGKDSVALTFPHPKIMERSDLNELPLMPGQQGPYVYVDVGNPHLICFLSQMDQIKLDQDGPLLSNHPLFNAAQGGEVGGVNVSFVHCRDRQSIDLVVWERGAGFTGACGTAACAVMVAASQRGLVDSTVMIHQQGGDLELVWEGETLKMTGPAQTVFRGIYLR